MGSAVAAETGAQKRDFHIKCFKSAATIIHDHLSIPLPDSTFEDCTEEPEWVRNSKVSKIICPLVPIRQMSRSSRSNPDR